MQAKRRMRSAGFREGSMTKAELIAALETVPDDAQIYTNGKKRCTLEVVTGLRFDDFSRVYVYPSDYVLIPD